MMEANKRQDGNNDAETSRNRLDINLLKFPSNCVLLFVIEKQKRENFCN